MGETMTTEQKIISLLQSATKGMVKISPATAAKIIDLVLNPGQCKAVLRRYSHLKNDYEVMQTIETNQDKVNQLLAEALLKKPVEMFYRYDLYNEANELQGFIYTANSNLI
jgi:hypothetical protein